MRTCANGAKNASTTTSKMKRDRRNAKIARDNAAKIARADERRAIGMPVAIQTPAVAGHSCANACAVDVSVSEVRPGLTTSMPVGTRVIVVRTSRDTLFGGAIGRVLKLVPGHGTTTAVVELTRRNAAGRRLKVAFHICDLLAIGDHERHAPPRQSLHPEHASCYDVRSDWYPYQSTRS